MINDEEDEPCENDNNKYIMFSKEEKDIKKDGVSDDNEIENDNKNEIIPSLPYKTNFEGKEKRNLKNENNLEGMEMNQNILSNDYDEVKMNIKNYLKDKIEKQNIETNEDIENEDINNNASSDLKENNNLIKTNENHEPNLKENLTQLQITNSSLSKGLKNAVINSTKTSLESLGNSIDNYIKMENLYLQDGKINSTTTNYDISNTNNLTTNNNNNINIKNSKNSFNKLNEMRKEKLINKLKQKKEEEEIQINNSLDKQKESLDENNIRSINDNYKEKKDNNDNFIDKNLDINYHDLISEYQQKLREEKANELKQKAKDKLRPKIHDEIYKKEYNNIVNQIYRELENQLKEELDKKMTDELNYIKKKENFNQKIKFEQIDNEIKEKVKNEFEEELNKELIIKEKEIKIKYNQKLENFKKNFRNELNEEYEKKKKEMKNQLNDIKSKIYRSRCSEKIKITKINKMKKNIGNYNEKNIIGIKKIDKILGNESNEEEEENNQKEGTENMIPPSLLNNKTEEENNYNDKEYNFGQDYNYNYLNDKNNTDNNINYLNNICLDDNNEEENIYYNKINNNDNKINHFKGNNQGDNSVNLAEINNRIKESTNKINKNQFFDIETKKEQEIYLNKNDINNTINDNNYNFPQEDDIQNYFDIKEKDINKLNRNLRGKTYEKNNNIFIEKEKDLNQDNNIKTKLFNKHQIKIKTNLNNFNDINNYNPNNYTNLNNHNNKDYFKNNNFDFIFDKNKNIFYSLQISPNIPKSISNFGKFLISHVEKEENYKTLFYRELKSFKLKIRKIFSNTNTTDHCLTDYLLDIWEKIEVSFYIRYQIMKNIIRLNANDLYMFLDRETEYLTNYYQISENIFKDIKKRENIKAKLQAKTNRNEIILEIDRNKLDEVTQSLEENIKIFKKQYEGMNIIWKGIYYEWFMNYEKWFYEMEIKDDSDYLN